MRATDKRQVRTSAESAKAQGGTCVPINPWNQVLGQEGEKHTKKGIERPVSRVESEAAPLRRREEDASSREQDSEAEPEEAAAARGEC